MTRLENVGKKMKRIGNIKKCLPYSFLVLAIVLPWFLESGYLFLTDNVWGPAMPLPSWWSGHVYLGLIIKALNPLLPMDLLQKIFITGVLGMVLFGGHKIAENFSKDKIILFLSSTFVLFNPFVYDRMMYGQFGTILAYGLFLAFFGYLLCSYLSPPFPLEKKQLFLSAIFAGLSILFAPHFGFFVGLVYFIFFILFLIKIRKLWQEQSFLMLKNLALAVLIILIINFNWLLGVFLGRANVSHTIEKRITGQDLVAFHTAGRTKLEAVENVLLMSGFWGAEQHRYERLEDVEGNWGRSFYLLLPIIVLGFVVGLRKGERKKRLTIGLATLFVIAFILALGVSLPTSAEITLWLFDNMPFYQGLRETQKWVAVMVAVYEVFLILGLVKLFERKIVIQNRTLMTILLSFVIIFQAPLLVWGCAGQLKPINYPSDWYEVNDIIVQQTDCYEKEGNKILFLPWHMYMHFRWVGNIVGNPSAKFFDCPVICGKNMEFGGIYGYAVDREGKEVEKWLFSHGKINILEKNELNISHILLAKEVDWKNYSWIDDCANLELIKETENLKLYEKK